MKRLAFIAAVVLVVLTMASVAFAQVSVPRITVDAAPMKGPQETSTALQIMALLTVLSVAPAILLLMTCFTRIVIVLSLLRHAIGVQQLPPNQVVVGLALFLTIFVMAPVGIEVNEKALQPYLDKRISQNDAFAKAMPPVREFMLKQTREKDLALMVQLAKAPAPASPSDIPIHVIVPAFALSEIKTAFQMGVVLFIPFLVIDMVVASVLTSMGMMMLPPVMISLPFKLLLFVLADGWYLVVRSLVAGYR